MSRTKSIASPASFIKCDKSHVGQAFSRVVVLQHLQLLPAGHGPGAVPGVHREVVPAHAQVPLHAAAHVRAVRHSHRDDPRHTHQDHQDSQG